MRVLTSKTKIMLGGTLAVLLAMSSTQAGSATFNFDEDPAGVLTINSNNPEVWKPTGGNPDTGGYVSITDSLNSQYSVIIMPDFDSGLVVKAFTFACDVRVGNPMGNSGRPADGFSISYARASDQVIATGGDPNTFAVAGAPENGTATGIAISFDTWSGNVLPDGPDIEGIMVRVDNVTVLRKDMPTRNGGCTDTTSIQTGPYDGVDNETGLPTNLCWARLEVELNESAQLTVKYKGAALLDKYQTQYFPSAGRLVLAGRTGGANENHHVDNVSITTTPADKAMISGFAGNAVGFIVKLSDVGASVVDEGTLVTKLNGTVVQPTKSKIGAETTLQYNMLPAYLAAGSQNTVDISFKDTRGVEVTGSPTFTVGAFAVIPADYATVPGVVDKTRPGFKVRVSQIRTTRYPIDENYVANAERQLADGYIDPATGRPFVNLADLSQAQMGYFIDEDVINWNQEMGAGGTGTEIGNFTSASTPSFLDEPIPGMPGVDPTWAPTDVTDSVAAEIMSYLELKAGVYRFGVNSDDGFKVNTARDIRDTVGVTLGMFNGGRGSSDTLFDVLVPVDGMYPVRVSWWEGTGGANVEFFLVDAASGAKILVNDVSNPASVKAYRFANLDYPHVVNVSPGLDEPGVMPTADILVEVVDGVVQVDGASFALTLNGQAQTPTVTKTGNRTKLLVPSSGLLPSASTQKLTLSFKDKGSPAKTYDYAWQFNVVAYVVMPTEPGTPPGSGDDTKPGFNVKTYQLASRGNTMPNNLEWAEGIMAGGLGANEADLTSFVAGVYAEAGTINYSQDVAEEAGNFRPEKVHPGIPGVNGSMDNYASEITTYVEFPKAGYYVMGVNSDDNFRVTVTETLGRQFLEILGPDPVKGFVVAVPSARDLNAALGGSLPRTPIEGDIVMVSTITACGAAGGIPEDLTGKIALIQRGGCTFVEKGQTAQAKGAIAVIIHNQSANAGNFPIVMGGDTTSITIPIMMIDYADGMRLRDNLTGLRGRIGRDNAYQLGEFNGNGRGSADTLFGVLVQKAGVYPLRCVYMEGGGGANVEWFAVIDGEKILLNDTANAKALKAYRARKAVTQPTISISLSGANVVITFTGVLQEADEVNGPYKDVAGATSPKTITVTAPGKKFYRASSM